LKLAVRLCMEWSLKFQMKISLKNLLCIIWIKFTDIVDLKNYLNYFCVNVIFYFLIELIF